MFNKKKKTKWSVENLKYLDGTLANTVYSEPHDVDY